MAAKSYPQDLTDCSTDDVLHMAYYAIAPGIVLTKYIFEE